MPITTLAAVATLITLDTLEIAKIGEVSLKTPYIYLTVVIEFSLIWGMWVHEKMVDITKENQALTSHHYALKARIFNALIVQQHFMAILLEILAYEEVIPCVGGTIGHETNADCIIRVWPTIFLCLFLSMRLRKAYITHADSDHL